MKADDGLSRRNFTALLAASGAVWSLADSPTVRGQEKASPPTAKTAPPPAEKPAEKPVELPAPTAGELALHLLLARFPDERLDPAAQVSLLIDIERHLARSRSLAQVELTNGDEPGFLFAAYRRPELAQ